MGCLVSIGKQTELYWLMADLNIELAHTLDKEVKWFAILFSQNGQGITYQESITAWKRGRRVIIYI